MATPDPRGLQQVHRGITYVSPLSYEGEPRDALRAITEITWLSRTAVPADAEKDLEEVWLYAWDGQLYRSVDVEALSSCVLRYIIAIDDVYIYYF